MSSRSNSVRVLISLGLVVLLAACAGPASGLAATSAAAIRPSASAVSADIPVPALPSVPVDWSLTPVSRGNPGAEARAALDLCVRPEDSGAVAGMALLPSARDVKKYMFTNGKEPELQDD